MSRCETPNFKARYLYGNVKRGLINLHINIRSLYNKIGEIKRLINQEKPHLIGISECELSRKVHDLNTLKIQGYHLLLPKSWEVYDKARVVVYVKKSLEFEHLEDLEDKDLQTIWIKASFKNARKVFYCHQYREHGSTLGNSLAAQRLALSEMIKQWEAALKYGNPVETNEVHLVGDMNVDSYMERWLDPTYSLVTLGRMIFDFCNANNFQQVVNQITRIQFNSVEQQFSSSCIDHVYCNARYRITPVRVISFGSSDHDALLYCRLSKEPKQHSRTIRKRSYKHFDESAFIEDVSKMDFTDVYSCLDVDIAASILTFKLIEVLNKLG